ncbi:phytanoyl-CoA dioxygenase family protein [Ilumatobacter nonamiensis]|uniref:phytanoyl-CoA dioxygenase family protein n=1 Tax=Ilumatobacter nonamiensis TaxID=467093 RepID=UPI00058B8560|nr:phytanoyl-CoA dioxygenase family protein [Ilumatobacter nonamiensis]
MGVIHLPASTPAAEIHDVLATEGALVIDELASPDVIDRIAAEMAEHVDDTPLGSDDFSGRSTKRTGALIARSETARELVTHPLVLDVAGRLLHQATKFQIHLTQIISIGPDSPGQAIHRDEWAFDFFPFPSDVHPQCNTIWAMTDFTEENGATRVIPRSQDWEVDMGHQVSETVAAEMTKGSCLLYTGKVYHGGGANRSDVVRSGLNLTYCAAWLRQEENQYLSCPPEVAAELDDDLLKLMGYQIGAYALGYVDDVRDPLAALRGSTGSMSFAAN